MFKKKYTLGEKIGLCLPGLFVMGVIGFLWFFLFGSYHTILFERAPITPLYAEGWVYQSIEIFSIIGMIAAFFSINAIVKNYKGNIGLQIRKIVLYQILLYLLFLLVTPQYTIQLVPQVFGFTDMHKEYVTNTKLYFFWIDKLGFSYVRYYKFQTLDDAIQGLEFAKGRDDGLYSYIFNDLNKYGYENVFKKYHDEEFQIEFIKGITGEFYVSIDDFLQKNIDKLPIYAESISNKEIKDLYFIYFNGYKLIKEAKSTPEEERTDINRLGDYIEEKISNIHIQQ